ncbi:MAG: tetratricopeptide repeat protein, partial [Anaerolineae bacterium]|nr:tetratricopeptide repeat protein [Anaerolineae bacterium]
MKTKYLCCLLLSVALLVSCDLPTPPPLSPAEPPFTRATATATLPPAPTSTQTPTPSPSPTPTAPPTPAPHVLLERADQAYAVGDWDTAESLYGLLMPLSAISQEQAFHTAFGLGKTLIASEQYSRGIELLESLATTETTFPQETAVRLFLADTLLATGNPAQSIPYYETVAADDAILAPYTYEWLGDAHFATGVYSPALTAYQQALDLTTALDRQVYLREKIALTFGALGNYNEALGAYDAILNVAQIPAYRARIAFQAAETARLFGDETEALRRFEEIVLSYPAFDQGYQALVQLVEASVAVDDLLRGKIDYYAGAYGPAVQAFYRHIAADPEHTGEPHYYAGLSYLNAGSYNLAVAEFDMLLDTHPGDAYWGSAWIGKA